MENFEKIDGAPETNEEQDTVVEEEVVEETTAEEIAVEEISAEVEEPAPETAEEFPAEEISEEAVEDAPADEEIIVEEPKKESKAVSIAIISVVAVVVALILYLLFFGGVTKKAITAEEFTKISEGMDLTVTDYSKDASVDPNETDAFLMAENLDMYLQFWDFKSESKAKELFAGILPSFRENSTKHTESSGINYESGKYYGENGEYIYIIRIGDIIVSGENLSEGTDPVDIAMAKLGY